MKKRLLGESLSRGRFFFLATKQRKEEIQILQIWLLYTCSLIFKILWIQMSEQLT